MDTYKKLAWPGDIAMKKHDNMAKINHELRGALFFLKINRGNLPPVPP